MICYKVINLETMSSVTHYAPVRYELGKQVVRNPKIQGPFACFDTLENAMAFVGDSSQYYGIFKCRITKSKCKNMYFYLNSEFLAINPKVNINTFRYRPLKIAEKRVNEMLPYSTLPNGKRQVELIPGTVLADKVTLIEKIS